MNHKIIILTVTAFFALLGQMAGANNVLTLPVDYGTFYIPSEATTYVEFYYSLYRHQLGFVESEQDGFGYAGVLISATVFNEAGEIIDSASTYFLSKAENGIIQTDDGVRLFDYLPMKMMPGNYRVEISAIDDVSKATGQTILKVSVPDFSGDQLMSSSLELAYDIHDVPEGSSSTNSRLIKEGRMVVPNPTGVYQSGVDSVLFVYSELYGLASATSEDERFTVYYRVKDISGNDVYNMGPLHYRKPGNSAVLANMIDISTLRPGQYFLFLEVEDTAAEQQVMETHRFALTGSLEGAPASSEEDVQLMVDIAWYHLSEAEKIRVGDLSPEGKVNLIRQFWRDRDDDPSTPENPVYDEAVKRFKYANDNFSSQADNQDGWRTDRGRVYISYGPSDEQQEEIMTGKSYPYIKWDYYRLEGGCIFVFVNDFVAGAIDYRLVHSTHPREKYDPRWEGILKESDDQAEDWRSPGDEDF